MSVEVSNVGTGCAWCAGDMLRCVTDSGDVQGGVHGADVGGFGQALSEYYRAVGKYYDRVGTAGGSGLGSVAGVGDSCMGAVCSWSVPQWYGPGGLAGCHSAVFAGCGSRLGVDAENVKSTVATWGTGSVLACGGCGHAGGNSGNRGKGIDCVQPTNVGSTGRFEEWSDGPVGTKGHRDDVGPGECTEVLGGEQSVSQSDLSAGVVLTCATKTEFNRQRKRARKDRLRKAKKESQGAHGAAESVQPVVDVATRGSIGIPKWRQKVEVRQGFFSECSKDVQRELKETRARLLIEENKRKLAQEQAKLRALDQTSPEYLAREYLRVMSLAGKMRELKDEKVGKWATVVAESMVHTVATSAPSSVPSLESVGFGNSALKSSSGSELSERKTLFEAEKLCLDSHYQSLDFYLPADYSNALGRLKEDFADVVFESAVAERVKEKVTVEKFISNSELEGATKERAFNAYRSEFQDVIQLCGTD